MSGECNKCGEHTTDCRCRLDKVISHPWKISSKILPRKGCKVLVTDGYIIGMSEYDGDSDGQALWLSHTGYFVEPIFWRFLPDLPEYKEPIGEHIGCREDL